MSEPTIVELGEIMASKSGSVDPSRFPDEVFDLYSIPAFDRGAPEVLAGKEIGSAKQIVEPGDVLLSKIVPHIRRTWVVGANRGRRIIASGEWIVFRGDRVHPQYMRHVLVGDPFHTQFMQTVSGVGGSLLRARPAHVAKITVPLPPLPKQRRTAEVLDRTEELRSKRRDALAQLDTLTQSIFVDMFGDPATNPKGWPRVTLGAVFEIARGGSPRPIDDYVTDDPAGINWITISDASAGSKYITGTKRRIRPEGAKRSRAVKPGDFLLTNSMSFGRPYIMRTSGCIHDGWLVLSPRRDDVDSEFFYCLLGSTAVFAEFERRAAGATVKNLNIELVRAVKIPLPPFSGQRDFSRRAAAIDSIKSAHRASLMKLDSLFASLQHRAFRGEL